MKMFGFINIKNLSEDPDSEIFGQLDPVMVFLLNELGFNPD